jgi:hypothetical protein
MLKIVVETEFEAPPEKVFDLLADHSKHVLWNPNMIESRLYKDGPIVKGSKGITIGNNAGRRYENEVYYEKYDRPTFVSGGTTSGNIDALMSNKFIPTENGTKVIYKLEVSFKGFLRILQPFMKKQLLKQKEEEMEDLRKYLMENK